MFTLYTRYTLTMPEGVISESGVYAIINFLEAQDLTVDAWKDINPTNEKTRLPNLPNDWQWVWIVQRGAYAGTMPKRVSKYYHKVHGLTLPQSVLVTLGNIARSHTSEQASYTFEFANKIDWKAGDFGESSGSCWWGSYSGSRVMWDANGGLSIRFYNETGHGFARAWVMEVDTNLYTVMNGYGLSTLQITRVFAQFTGLSYKQIHLDNSMSTSLFINGDSGYIVGSIEVISEIEYWDFGMEGDDAYTCNSCGRTIDDDNRYTGADDNDYCENCYYDNFSSCENCGETYYNDDLNYIESIGSDVCNWCLSHHYGDCDRCGETYRDRHLTNVGEKTYCRNCVTELRILGDNIE